MPEDLLPDFDLKIMPGRGVICSPPYLVLYIHTNLISCTNKPSGQQNNINQPTETIKTNRLTQTFLYAFEIQKRSNHLELYLNMRFESHPPDNDNASH